MGITPGIAAPPGIVLDDANAYRYGQTTYQAGAVVTFAPGSTLNLSNGSTFTNNGGGGGGGGGTLTPTVVQTGSYTASPSDFAVFNTTADASAVLQLPTAPADKTVIGGKIVVLGAGPNNGVAITCGAGDAFDHTGGATVITLLLYNQGLICQYSAAARLWYVTGDDIPLSQLDGRYLAIGGNAVSATTANTASTATSAATATFATTAGNAATVTTNANLTGDTTSAGNTTTTGKVNGTAIPASPGIGQVPAATSTTAAVWVSGVNNGSWVFDVRTSGAKGDGQIVTDGAMSSSSSTTTLTCGTSAPFVPGDVNKAIVVKGANTVGVTSLVGTIATYVSATQVTLSVACTVTVSGATVMWATDDTAAVQTTINNAVTYAKAHSGTATVYVPPPPGAFYGIAGALVTGGSTLGNSQLTLPVISGTGQAVTLTITSGNSCGATRYFNQLVPATAGTTLFSMAPPYTSAGNQNTAINGNGNASLIGGPTGKNGYGNASLFSNMTLVLDGVILMTTHSANGFTYSAGNFWGLSRVEIRNCGWGTAATFAGGDFSSLSTFGTGVGIGILLPGNSNNAHTVVDNCTCNGGYTYGIYATEHAVIKASCLLYCWALLCPVGVYGDGGSGTGAVHAVYVDQIALEGCINHVDMIGNGSGGVGPTLRGMMDCESTQQWTGTGLGDARGSVRLYGSGLTTVTLATASAVEVINDFTAPGPISTPSFALNTAQINTTWRWANVWVAITTGTGITSIQVSQLRGGALPALTTIYSQATGPMSAGFYFRVPPGGWWVINATAGTAPTMVWVLD